MNPFQEYSVCCGALMDHNQTMCPECLEPCEKETINDKKDQEEASNE